MKFKHLLTTTILIGGVHSVAQAQTAHGLDEIIVTAQKVTSTVQNTGAAIAVVDGESLSNRAQTTADEALKNLVGVEVQGAARGSAIAIRGLGSDLPPGVGESSVSTNFDGVYNIRAEATQLGFYDLDRIEVLRGPQGTLYGRNATAGVVNVISKDPVLGETGGHATVGIGSYSLLHGDAAFNVPLTENTALRVAVAGINRNGYLNNDHDDSKAFGARVKYLYEPNQDLRVLVGAENVKLGGKGPGGVEIANYDAGNTHTTADPAAGSQDFDGYKVYSKIDVTAGMGTVTFIPAYQKGKGSIFGVFGGRGSDGFDPKNIEQTSLELRYASLPDSPVEWVVGGFYYDYEQRQEIAALSYDATTQAFTTSSFVGYTQNEGKSTAIFGQATVPVGEKLRLIAGLRNTWDERYAEGKDVFATYSGSRDDTFFDWKAGGEYDLSEDGMLYATIATGFRPGGTNPFNGTTFEPESLTSYEIGSKNRFLDGSLQFNTSAFYYDYKDFQVVDFFIGATGPNLIFYNADATNWGIEADLLAQVSDAGRLNISASFLDSEIKSNLILHPADPFTEANFNGERLPHSPKWTIKGGYEHDIITSNGGHLIPRLDARYVSEHMVAPNNTSAGIQDGYFSGDISLSYTPQNEQYTLTGYVKNVTDEVVKRAYFVGYAIVGAPITYGVSISANF